MWTSPALGLAAALMAAPVAAIAPPAAIVPRPAVPPPAAGAAPGYFPALPLPTVDQVAIGGGAGPTVLIVVDALRPDHLTPYGAPRDTSPNLMALAREGVVLSEYFANASWTRPSTASMLTGVAPHVHRVERDPDQLGPDLPTFVTALRAAGIPTGAVVGNGNAGSAFGMARGFSFYADTVDHWEGLPTADQVFSLGLPFLRAHAHEPAFLLLFVVDVHDPYRPPPAYADRFVRDRRARLVRSPRWEGGRYSRAEVRRMQDAYDGAVAATDAAIGRLVAELKAMGAYDQATIMVTADHGEGFGEHGAFLHAHQLWDELLRVPMIVRAPRMDRRGVVHAGLFQSLDLFPTLAHHLGAVPLGGLPGRDLFAALAASPAAEAAAEPVIYAAFHNFGISRAAARTRRHKVILDLPADARQFAQTVGPRRRLPSVRFDRPRWRAFDLLADPMERRDLAANAPSDRAPPAGQAWTPLAAALAAQAYVDPAPAANAGPVPETVVEDLRALGYVN